MKNFYIFDQNNSGGVFDVDETVAHRVVIEANTLEEATDKAGDIGIYFDYEFEVDCECCGMRWYGGEELELEGHTLDEVLQERANRWGWTSPDIIVHFDDGTKKSFYTESK